MKLPRLTGRSRSQRPHSHALRNAERATSTPPRGQRRTPEASETWGPSGATMTSSRVAAMFSTPTPGSPEPLGEASAAPEPEPPTPKTRAGRRPSPKPVKRRPPKAQTKVLGRLKAGVKPEGQNTPPRWLLWLKGRLHQLELNPGAIIGLGIVLLLLAVGVIGFLGPRTTTSTQNTDQQRQAISNNVLDLCARDDQLSAELHRLGTCDVALSAAAIPSATVDGRTDAEINALIAKYIVEHPTSAGPGRADPAQVVEAARQVLAANPELYRGPAGPAPDATAVNNAVASYITSHLADFQGKQGEPGKAGDPGAAGRGVSTGPRFERNAQGACESVVTYTDGTEDRAAAGDAACPGGTTSPPDTTEQPPPTTEQPNPTTEPTPTENGAPTTAPTTTPTDPGLLGGLLGG